MKENMTTNNKPAFEIFVVREVSNKKSYFTKIGAAWPTKSGSGYNADLIALPVDGKFILLPPKDLVFADAEFHFTFLTQQTLNFSDCLRRNNDFCFLTARKLN